MERFFFNTNFHYVRIVPVNNGKTVPVDVICRHISSMYITTNMNPDITFVWIDREGRSETSDEIREKVRSSLIGAGADEAKLWVGVPDTMTENWLLADPVAITQEFGIESHEYLHEGKNGKHRISELYDHLGVNYKEMKHGASLMKRLRLNRAAENSPSAASFFQDWTADCWWTPL